MGVDFRKTRVKNENRKIDLSQFCDIARKRAILLLSFYSGVKFARLRMEEKICRGKRLGNILYKSKNTFICFVTTDWRQCSEPFFSFRRLQGWVAKNPHFLQINQRCHKNLKIHGRSRICSIFWRILLPLEN